MLINFYNTNKIIPKTFSKINPILHKKNNLLFKLQTRFMMDFDPKKDYYKFIGVSPEATEKEIKSAYYKLAKKYHPDLNGGKQTNEFKEMTNAYDILSDAKKKQEYDAMRKSSFDASDAYSSYGKYSGQSQNYGNYSNNNYYKDQNSYSNDNTNSSNSSENFEEKIRDRFRKSGFSNAYTKNSYKDPKTGEWKTYTNSQRNPFKDFEDLFRNASQKQQQNKNYYYDNNSQYTNNSNQYDQYNNSQNQQNTNKDDPFRSYWERNKNYDYRFKRKSEEFYDDNSSYDPNRFNNKTYNPFGSNNSNSNYNSNDFNYDHAPVLLFRFIRRIFIFTSLFMLFSFLFRRRTSDYHFFDGYGGHGAHGGYAAINPNYAYSQYPNPNGSYVPGEVSYARPVDQLDPYDPSTRIKVK
jgi:curved DNA-binding protein CbpA